MTGQTRTLPASWYRSKPLYELEQQAIFLKAWHLLGPITRFEDQEEVPYEIAGVRFIVENKFSGDNELKVLRLDDAYPLPQKLTSSGLLFAAISPEAPSFEEYFPGLEDLLARVDFTTLPFRRTLSYEGRFNWKTMVDGYQECLHCQYTHKSFSQLYPPTFYTVHNHGNYSRHFVTDPGPLQKKTHQQPPPLLVESPNNNNNNNNNQQQDHDEEPEDDGLFLYFFPICTLNVYGGGMTSFRVCPSSSSPGLTRMEFDYYHHQPPDSSTFAAYFHFVRRVALEDYELCERAQQNLESGVYAQGVLNPEKEGGVIHYQGLVRERVLEEFRREEEKMRDEKGQEGEGKEGGQEVHKQV